MVFGEAGIGDAAHEVQGGGVYLDEGRGWSSYAVLHGVSSAVLFSDDGRDGDGDVPEGVEMVMPGDNVTMEVELIHADRDGEGIAFCDS